VRPRTVALIFLALGAVHVALGVWMVFAPRSFYEALATFPPRNDHYIRDIGTFSAALGIAFVAAASRPAWRGGVLLVAIVQYAVHLGVHLYDLDRPPEEWVGPVTAALVAAGLALLALVAYAVNRR
jgi:uncharacterized protein YjeT (DUF2065 family)